MAVSSAELKRNLLRYVDQVIESGEQLEIIHKGTTLCMVIAGEDDQPTSESKPVKPRTQKKRQPKR